MTQFSPTQRRSEQGFTLVELAIVMVIIGLLIAGILKGQELIANAKISATVSQIKSVDAAINTFQDKYNALPGDIATPTTRLPNCAVAPCLTAGTGGTLGNSQIEGGAVIATPAAGSEAGLVFVHLAAADLVSGVVPTGGQTFGGLFPAVKAGGGLWVAYSGAAIANTTLAAGRHYASLAGAIGANAAGTGVLNATAAAQIDRKIDDGLPQLGSYQTFGATCINGTAYDEATGAGTCTSYTRVLN